MKRVSLNSFAALSLTGLLGISMISGPIAANASEEGSRNTAYALGAVALGILLTQHHNNNHRHEHDNCDYSSNTYQYRENDRFHGNRDNSDFRPQINYRYDRNDRDNNRKNDRREDDYNRNDRYFHRHR